MFGQDLHTTDRDFIIGAKYGIIEPLAGAMAMTLRRSVKVQFSRSDDFLTTMPSGAMIIQLKTGF